MSAGKLSLILVAVAAASAFSADGPTTVFIWPPKAPSTWVTPAQPSFASVAASSSASTAKNDPRDPAVRRAIIVAARNQREEDERRERIIQQARLREKADQMPAIDPEKDDFRKYLRQREMRQEPEWQAILEEHPEARPRDDFAEWKRRQPEKPAVPDRTPTRQMDWAKWLKSDPGLRDPKSSERSKKPAIPDVKEE